MVVELLYNSVKTEVKSVEFESQWQLQPVELSFGQLSRRPVELQAVELETRCGRESHTRPKRLGAQMSWGPEKMLIRCSKESQHPAEWSPAPGEQEIPNVDGHNNEVKILQLMFGFQLPLTVKPHTTFSNPCNKVRGNILLKKSSCVFILPACVCHYHCVCYSLRRYVSSIYMYISAWISRWQYNTTTQKLYW